MSVCVSVENLKSDINQKVVLKQSKVSIIGCTHSIYQFTNQFSAGVNGGTFPGCIACNTNTLPPSIFGGQETLHGLFPSATLVLFQNSEKGLALSVSGV